MSTKFIMKILQTQQVHQTQTWICTKYWKKIKICCRLISTYVKKLYNHIWYLSQCLISLSFLVTLFPWVKSEQWLRHSCITPSKVIKLFCKRCLFWLNVSLVDLAGKYFWTLLQLLNVDHGFLNTDPKSWQQNSSHITAHIFLKNLNAANDASEHALNQLTTFNTGNVTQRRK